MIANSNTQEWLCTTKQLPCSLPSPCHQRVAKDNSYEAHYSLLYQYYPRQQIKTRRQMNHKSLLDEIPEVTGPKILDGSVLNSLAHRLSGPPVQQTNRVQTDALTQALVVQPTRASPRLSRNARPETLTVQEVLDLQSRLKALFEELGPAAPRCAVVAQYLAPLVLSRTLDPDDYITLVSRPGMLGHNELVHTLLRPNAPQAVKSQIVQYLKRAKYGRKPWTEQTT